MNFLGALVITNSIVNVIVCSLIIYICVLGIKKAKKDNQKNITNKGYRR